jgi:CBS domain containing-hemolysin-like protein
MKKLKGRVDQELAEQTAAEFMQPDLAVLKADRTFGEALHTVKTRRHSSYPVCR